MTSRSLMVLPLLVALSACRAGPEASIVEHFNDDPSSSFDAEQPSGGVPSPSGLELNPTPNPKPTESGTDGPPAGYTSSLFPEGKVDPALQPYVDVARVDLASRLGVDVATIRTISAVLVTWGDTGMGCPEPGREYLQVPQDGSIIELGWSGRVYRYHSGGTRTPFLCDQPMSSPPPTAGGAEP